jgi:hypothetical protein
LFALLVLSAITENFIAMLSASIVDLTIVVYREA